MVIMGVSGSGKSTIGGLLARALDLEFFDADDLHPQASKNKMRSGIPLDDFDRIPWLHLVGQRLAKRDNFGNPVIIACSALKSSYRELIRSHEPRARFIHLVGPEKLLLERIDCRNHAFMPAALLSSQLEILEEPRVDELAMQISIERSPQEILEAIIAWLGPGGAETKG